MFAVDLIAVNWSWFGQIIVPGIVGAVVSIILVAYYDRVRFCRRRRSQAVALVDELEENLIPAMQEQIKRAKQTNSENFRVRSKAHPKKSSPLWYELRLETIQTFGADFFHYLDGVLEDVQKGYSQLHEGNLSGYQLRIKRLKKVTRYLKIYGSWWPAVQGLGLFPWCVDYRLKEEQ